MAKVKADKDEIINKLLAQIREVSTNTARISEKVDTYEDHMHFIEDVNEYKSMQKMKHRLMTSSKGGRSTPILPNFGKQKSLLKEIVAQHLKNNKGK